MNIETTQIEPEGLYFCQVQVQGTREDRPIQIGYYDEYGSFWVTVGHSHDIRWFDGPTALSQVKAYLVRMLTPSLYRCLHCDDIIRAEPGKTSIACVFRNPVTGHWNTVYYTEQAEDDGRILPEGKDMWRDGWGPGIAP